MIISDLIGGIVIGVFGITFLIFTFFSFLLSWHEKGVNIFMLVCSLIMLIWGIWSVFGTIVDGLVYEYGVKSDLFKYHSENIVGYSQKIEKGTKSAKIYYSRGDAYYYREDYSKAIVDYTTAIQLNPKKAVYYANRGHSYSKIGDYGRAIEDFSVAIKMKPYKETYYYIRGRAYYEVKDFEKAISDFEISLDKDPLNKDKNEWLTKAKSQKSSSIPYISQTSDISINDTKPVIENFVYDEDTIDNKGTLADMPWKYITLLGCLLIILIYAYAVGYQKKHTFVCPYCFSSHKIKDCDMVCSYTSAGKYVQLCKHGVEKDGRGFIPKGKKHKCLKCKDARQTIYCAVNHREMSTNILNMKSLSIALLGAKDTGKSNYIGVLVEEIDKKMSSSFNTSLFKDFSGETKNAYEQYYYNPLYKDGYAVEATAGGEIPPLIFALQIQNSYKATALTFYDTAGENLDDVSKIHLFNSYIPNAHGIILLLDPLQVPDLRDQLKAKGLTDSDLPPQNTETANVLEKIVSVIKDTRKIKGKIDIPLALVFTKIDVLEKLLPDDCCLKVDSEHIKQGKFAMEDFKNTQNEMKDLIDNWIRGSLMSKISHFKHYAFFGVTALGQNPSGRKLSGAVRPRRVLDPLLWLLAENKYIKVKK